MNMCFSISIKDATAETPQDFTINSIRDIPCLWCNWISCMLLSTMVKYMQYAIMYVNGNKCKTYVIGNHLCYGHHNKFLLQTKPSVGHGCMDTNPKCGVNFVWHKPWAFFTVLSWWRCGKQITLPGIVLRTERIFLFFDLQESWIRYEYT